MVDIGVKNIYIEKHAIYLKDYRIRPFLSIRHAHGDLCKHLGIDSSIDLRMCINARQSLCVFTVCVLPVYVFGTFPFQDILLVARTQRDNIHPFKNLCSNSTL